MVVSVVVLKALQGIIQTVLDKALSILKIVLDRGDEIIDLLHLGEFDKADNILMLRKAAIYNFFSTPIAQHIMDEHFDVTERLLNKILKQNEILEKKIEEKRRESIVELKSVVNKKFQFQGYVNATNIKLVNFEGRA